MNFYVEFSPNVYFYFTDNKFIKCIYTTEVTRRISGCVSTRFFVLIFLTNTALSRGAVSSILQNSHLENKG